jgi:tRNA threonylcarbamoyladenosine biosynthesis protein TsaB
MLIITIRTDKPEAELGLSDDKTVLAYDVWPAHRELSATIHKKLATLLEEHGRQLEDIEGIVCFKGPGSFTGLRIGLTVGNELAYGLGVPIKGTMGDDWAQAGIAALLHGETDVQVIPEYGAEAHITIQKK